MWRALALIAILGCGPPTRPAPAPRADHESAPHGAALTLAPPQPQTTVPPHPAPTPPVPVPVPVSDDSATLAASAWPGARSPSARSYLSVAAAGGRVFAIGGINKSVGGGLYHVDGAVDVFDPSAGTWTANQSMPTPRFSASAAVIGGTIYVVGGHVEQPVPSTERAPQRAVKQGSPYANHVEAYEIAADRWTTRAPMHEERSEPASAAVGDQLYVFGGTNGHRILQTTERYDSKRNAWVARAPMPRERQGGSAAVVSGRVFLFGGIRGDGQPITEIDIYDPAKDRWAVSPAALPKGLWLVSAVPVGGSIVLTGGSYHDDRIGMVVASDVRVYDVATAAWSSLPPLAIGRVSHGAAVVGDKLYVLGGCRDGCNVELDAVEVIALGRLPRTKAKKVASVALPAPAAAKPGVCAFADATTGLCWQDPPADRTMTRTEAIQHCDQLEDRGFTDWRLPTVDELVTLVRGRNMSSCAAVDPTCLDATCGEARGCSNMDKVGSRCFWDRSLHGTCSWYHSSSKVNGAPYDAWFIYFDSGALQWGAENIPKHVRCVRGSRRQLAR